MSDSKIPKPVNALLTEIVFCKDLERYFLFMQIGENLKPICIELTMESALEILADNEHFVLSPLNSLNYVHNLFR